MKPVQILKSQLVAFCWKIKIGNGCDQSLLQVCSDIKLILYPILADF